MCMTQHRTQITHDVMTAVGTGCSMKSRRMTNCCAKAGSSLQQEIMQTGGCVMVNVNLMQGYLKTARHVAGCAKRLCILSASNWRRYSLKLEQELRSGSKLLLIL